MRRENSLGTSCWGDGDGPDGPPDRRSLKNTVQKSHPKVWCTWCSDAPIESQAGCCRPLPKQFLSLFIAKMGTESAQMLVAELPQASDGHCGRFGQSVWLRDYGRKRDGRERNGHGTAKPVRKGHQGLRRDPKQPKLELKTKQGMGGVSLPAGSGKASLRASLSVRVLHSGTLTLRLARKLALPEPAEEVKHYKP
ncbi:hypothetical protein C8J57DRAFT_1240005 [Mycena rebaudengoi]|nr:hypothetical protein C8J57DRAFT_1240005 [Mycena rebaudengoi]